MKTPDPGSIAKKTLGPLSAIWQDLIPEVRGTRVAALALESRLAQCQKEVTLLETQASKEESRPGGEKQPLVSIIVSTFKAEKTVNRALDSIGTQVYKNKEIVIVDDGSPTQDKTVELIKEFMFRNDTDLRIKFIPLPINTGFAAATRNAALTKASANIVTFLDDDDMLATQESLSKLMSPHLENRKLIASVGDFLICDSEGKPKKERNSRWAEGETPIINWEMLFGMSTMLSSIALKKEFAKNPYFKSNEDMGPYFEAINEAARVQYEEGATELADTIALVPEAIYKYCQRAGSAINKNDVLPTQRFRHFSTASTYAFSLPCLRLIPGCDHYMKARYSKHLHDVCSRVHGSSTENLAALVEMLYAKWLRVQWVNEPIGVIQKRAIKSLWKARAKAVIPLRLKREIKESLKRYFKT